MTYPHGGADEIWRDGNDTAYLPRKHEIRAWGRWIQARFSSLPATPADYGADGTVSGDTAAFLALCANERSVLIPPRITPYVLDETINIASGQHWRWLPGAEAQFTKDITLFHATDIEDWSFTGRPYIRGSLTSLSEDTSQIAFRVSGCRRYLVENLAASHCKGAGIYVDGNAATPPSYLTYLGQNMNVHSDRGVFSNPSVWLSRRGISITHDAGPEYLLFSNSQVTRCGDGVEIDAGNARFLGGNIGDNLVGVKLNSIGVNHGHGGLHGLNINHNHDKNLHAEGVTLGYTLDSCHFYGNPQISAVSGLIWLQGCSMVRFNNCVVDCAVYNDSGAGSGANYMTNCLFPTNHDSSGSKNTKFFSNNDGLGDLVVKGCQTKEGMAPDNDPSPVFVYATVGGVSQSITGGRQVVKFDARTKDKGAAYDVTTGLFTAPHSGIFTVSVNVQIAADSGLTSGGFLTIGRPGQDLRYAPVTVVSGTVGMVTAHVDLSLDAGETVGAYITQSGGANPRVEATVSAISIALRV